MPDHAELAALREDIKTVCQTADRIEACLIGTMEQPGGLVARVAKVEATANGTAREWRSVKKWVWGALASGIVAGGGVVKAVAELIGGQHPPSSP